MSRRVPRRQDTAQLVPTVGEHIPVLQIPVLCPDIRCRLLGRVGVPKMVDLLPGEPVLHVLCVQIPPAVVIHVILHTGAINLPNEKPASRPEQFRRQAHMVAVQMGCKNIHPVPVHLQLLQLTLHGQTAGGPAKACVNQQASLPLDQIAVQIFQRIPLQGNVQAPKALRDAIRHTVSPCFF